jgi:hypothetical protein
VRHSKTGRRCLLGVIAERLAGAVCWQRTGRLGQFSYCDREEDSKVGNNRCLSQKRRANWRPPEGHPEQGACTP